MPVPDTGYVRDDLATYFGALARLLATAQGEALLPLEGAIRAAAGPGTVALNVITGPYGQTFGDWLRDAGATVYDISVPFHTAVRAEQIRAAFAEHPEIDFVSLVHAEAATGNTNPVAEIGAAVGLPIVDGVSAAVKLAESLVALGLRTSKHGDLAFPPPKPFSGRFGYLGC